MSSSKTNIKLIIEGCLNNNMLSQDKLFEMYYGFVMSICMRYGDSREEAKEMLNDTFYTLFKNLDKYDAAYPIEPWLRKLCVNCCLKHRRKYFKYKDKMRTEEFTDQSSAYELMELPGGESYDYLKLLSKLPPACKTIINLYIIEEYKHQEIATMLDISVGTSKSNLHRAKHLLYKMLDKNDRGYLKLNAKYEG